MPFDLRSLLAALRPCRSFLLAVLVLLLGFAWPLLQLAHFAWGSTLYSHILLIPFVSLYLGWLRRSDWDGASVRWRPLALLPLLLGLALLGGFALASGWRWGAEDRLATTTAAFLFLVAAAGLAFLGAGTLRALAFPLGFLVFMIPFPERMTEALEVFLQHGSAAAARALFALTGPQLYYQDLVFHFPGGFSMQIAPECSGIHSTLVLFITSVLAGHLFLRSGWSKIALTLFVIPLALIRNGFRVFVIGQLCVNVGPEMIHAWIHRKGGPVFFALSLVPFLLLLFVLVKYDRPAADRAKPQTVS